MKKIKIWIMAALLLASSFALPEFAEAAGMHSNLKHKKSHLKHKKFKGQKSLNSKVHKKPKDPSYR